MLYSELILRKETFFTSVKLIFKQCLKGVLDVFLPCEDFLNIHNLFLWCSVTPLHMNNILNHSR